jgi:hypothetical protein
MMKFEKRMAPAFCQVQNQALSVLDNETKPNDMVTTMIWNYAAYSRYCYHREL